LRLGCVTLPRSEPSATCPREIAHGVRVTAVAAGPVETELLGRFTGSADRKGSLIAGVPAKRAGGPEEIGIRRGCVCT
jgi:NAD(P)-dependent dehydrogenase (short-subunit alcohol dehydrogenase family)